MRNGRGHEQERARGQQSRAGRSRNRRGEGGRLREELIEAARRLLATAEREAEVSIRAVTREAGAAPQSFYLQFASLDELLYAVYAVEYEHLRQAMAAAASRAPDPQARLVAVCTAYCQFAQAQPGRYRALTGIRGQLHHPGWDGQALPGAPAFGVIRDTVAQALAASGSPADPFLAAATLWASLHGLVTLRATRPAFPWPPLADMIAGLAGQAVSAPVSSARPADPPAARPS
jgi:AcrR family transcriptional regulator